MADDFYEWGYSDPGIPDAPNFDQWAGDSPPAPPPSSGGFNPGAGYANDQLPFLNSFTGASPQATTNPIPPKPSQDMVDQFMGQAPFQITSSYGHPGGAGAGGAGAGGGIPAQPPAWRPTYTPAPYVAPFTGSLNLPTYTAPTYKAPTYDLNRVQDLSQQAAAPGIRHLRQAVNAATARSYDNPNVGAMTLRQALEGYGSGLESVMGGAAQTGLAEYQPEFANQVGEAQANFGAKTTEAQTNYGAGVTSAQAAYNAQQLNWQTQYSTMMADWRAKMQYQPEGNAPSSNNSYFTSPPYGGYR